MYVCMPTLIATNINMDQYALLFNKDRLPEAIWCCVQTCSVNVVLLPHGTHAYSGVKQLVLSVFQSVSQSVSQWTQKIEIPSKQPIYPFSCLVLRYTPTYSYSRRITMPQIVFTACSVD